MKEALIRRSGNLIHVFPPNQELLAQSLTYKHRKQGTSGRKATYQQVELWNVVDGGLLAPAGFTSRISKLLREDGWKLRYEDYRRHTLQPPNFEYLDPLREGQDDLIIALALADCGIIQAPTGSGKSFIIRQVCKLWPCAQIIVTSPYTDIIRQTYEELREMIPPDEIGMIGGGRNQLGRRVSCAVSASLKKCDLENCELLIFDEVHRAAAPSTSEALAKVRNARMFGFSASVKGRSDNADLLTEALFGPLLCDISYQEVQKTGSIVPIMVCLFDNSHFDAVEAEQTAALERRGVWRNEQRNILIRDVVRQLQRDFVDPQILISVKTTEHAVYLGALLPEFSLCYASMGKDKRQRWERWGLIAEDTHPLSARQREQMQRDFTSGKLRFAIATGVWGTGVDFPGLNMIIRADAQSSSIQNTQVPGRVTRRVDGKTCGVVVDFTDDFNKTLGGRSKRRLTGYRKKGWRIEKMSVTEYRAQ